MSFLFYCFCFRSKSRKDYRKKLDNATAQIERELDLGRFIRRQRQHTIAILSLLSGSQTQIVTRMSKLTVGDGPVPSKSSDDASSSFDYGDQKASRAVNADRFVKQVLESTDRFDRKILQLFKVRQKLLTVS